MLDARVNNNLQRLVRKLADTRRLGDESDVVNAALREYLERNTDFNLDQEPPTKEYVAEAVLELKPAIIERDVVSISLFGSILHGYADKDSDIDFLVELNPDKPGSMTPIYEVGELLEDRFDRAVDVVMQSVMTKRWRRRGIGKYPQTMRIF